MKKTRQKKDQKLNPTDSLGAPSSYTSIQTNSASEHDIPTRVTDNPFLDWVGRFPLPAGQDAVSWVRKLRG
jgi:hypothetical protein